MLLHSWTAVNAIHMLIFSNYCMYSIHKQMNTGKTNSIFKREFKDIRNCQEKVGINKFHNTYKNSVHFVHANTNHIFLKLD